MILDVYKILSTTQDATDVELKKAWLLARSKHHPDKGGDAEVFKKVNAAWELVKTPNHRTAYHKTLKPKQSSNQHAFDDLFKYAQYQTRTATAKPSPKPKAQTNQSNQSQQWGSASRVYGITLKNIESAKSVLAGATFSFPLKPRKFILNLIPTYDELLIIGKKYEAKISGTRSILNLTFDIKFKAPWSWNNKLGLTYSTSRVLKNIVNGGSLKVKDLFGNVIAVKWKAFYPSSEFYAKGITLRVKGKGWPSRDLGQDLFIKIKPRKAPVKKTAKKSAFWY